MKLMPRFLEKKVRDTVPSILRQTPWRTNFVSFGKAQNEGVRFFNTTIIARGSEEWLITRKSEGPGFGSNTLVAFRLDGKRIPEAYIPIGLNTASYREQHFEDPRICVIGGKPWLSYCTFQIFPNERYSGAHQQVAILNDNWQPISRWDPIYGFNGGSILTGTGNEKNWTWFEHDGAPHLLYNIEPHTVVRWDGERPSETHQTETTPWAWGHMRGGTSPVQIKTGGDYTVFFHSSTMWTEIKRRYHMGAYQFEAKPPFRITRMTKKPILSGSHEDPWAEGLPLVVFPCGAIFVKGKWVVTMGVNDYCTAMMEIPHGDLERLMT